MIGAMGSAVNAAVNATAVTVAARPVTAAAAPAGGLPVFRRGTKTAAFHAVGSLGARAAVTRRTLKGSAAAPKVTRSRGYVAPAGGLRAVRASSETGEISTSDDEATSGYTTFQSREELQEAAMLDRHSLPTVPLSRTYQQTLRRSFSVVGIGLHSGEVETVRVCPAHAGEGRYFVRVPPGTIPAEAAKDEEGGSFSRKGMSSEEVEDMVLEQLRSMMSNKDELKDGTAERAAELRKKMEKKQEYPQDFGTDKDVRIPASLALVQDNLRLATRLQLEGASDEEGYVGTVEHLLSALEASGIDNVRIEVEGSGEIPILDGSAYQFCYEAARVGLVPASAKGGSNAETPRMAWKPKENIMVTEGDAFIMFNPDAVTKLTYGIDFTYKSRAIGKQWESWTPTEDGNYVDVISRARTFGTMPDIMAYFRAGYIRGGTEHCALIANGDQFWNPPMILPHENARHKLLDLIGDLSLLAEPGMAGVPVGHIVAYKAGHQLHAKFARKLKEAIEVGNVEKVPAEMWSREIGPEPSDAEFWGVDKVLPIE